MAAVNSICKNCKYQGKLGSLMVCDYILIKNKRRDCKCDGISCEKYEKKARKKRKAGWE